MQLFSSLSACFADKLKGGCGWAELGPIVNQLLSNMLMLGLFIAVLMIFYAGFVLVQGQGSAESRSRVKKIFIGIVIGIILLVGSYYIVEFILDTFGVKGVYRQNSIIERN
ncbi:hypothetical protein H7X65_03585 [Candidatus Parcubacteria bacterium]|nr:hypothetical protein [Candidatus Parcubacteria bacterium]